ncbi:MraY family glycosyltransferase [soil metagenome]
MSSAVFSALPFIVAAVAAATALGFVLTPLSIRLTRRLAAPDGRGHASARRVSRAGGLAVVFAFVGVGVCAVAFNGLVGALPQMRLLPQEHLWAVFGGVIAAASAGLLIDRFRLGHGWRLAACVGLAVVGLVAGLGTGTTFDAGAVELGGLAVVAATVISIGWTMAIIVSLDRADGVAGLSGGVALVAAVTLATASLTPAVNQPSVALLCAVLAGSLAGSLPWTFHPARVSLGASGVLAVGFALTALSVMGADKGTALLLVMAVPLADTMWMVLRRLSTRDARGRHGSLLHPRLRDHGLTHRGALFVIYAISLVLAVTSLVLPAQGRIVAFAGILVLAGVTLYLLSRDVTMTRGQGGSEQGQTSGSGR